MLSSCKKKGSINPKAPITFAADNNLQQTQFFWQLSSNIVKIWHTILNSEYIYIKHYRKKQDLNMPSAAKLRWHYQGYSF